MNKRKYVTAIMLALCCTVLSYVSAQSAALGEAMADTYRQNTLSDAAVITRADEEALQNAEKGTVGIITVKAVSGREICEKTKKLISGGENVYLSGMELTLTTSIGGAGKSAEIGDMKIGASEPEMERIYTLALGESAAREFEGEIVGTYSADISALRDYIDSFVPVTESNGEKAQESVKTQNEGMEIVKRQTPVLIWSMVLLAGIIAVYFIIRKRKSNEQ